MARQGRRADYEWAQFGDSVVGANIAENAVVIGITFLTATVPLTVVRIRGSILAQLDASAIDERVMVQFGIAVVSLPAATAGAGSVPSPVTEATYPFIWRGELSMSSLAEAAVQPDMLGNRITVDTKAMRKMKSTETLVLVAEVAASLDQGGTFDFLYSLNVLSAD